MPNKICQLDHYCQYSSPVPYHMRTFPPASCRHTVGCARKQEHVRSGMCPNYYANLQGKLFLHHTKAIYMLMSRCHIQLCKNWSSFLYFVLGINIHTKCVEETIQSDTANVILDMVLFVLVSVERVFIMVQYLNWY
jgi:hypothetical protein